MKESDVFTDLGYGMWTQDPTSSLLPCPAHYSHISPSSSAGAHQPSGLLVLVHTLPERSDMFWLSGRRIYLIIQGG